MALQKKIAELVVSLVIIAVLLPIGIGLVSVMGNMAVTYTNASGTELTVALSTIVDPTVLLLLTTLLPIIVAISIGMYFLEKKL
jgi:hypothetical protein